MKDKVKNKSKDFGSQNECKVLSLRTWTKWQQSEIGCLSNSAKLKITSPAAKTGGFLVIFRIAKVAFFIQNKKF